MKKLILVAVVGVFTLGICGCASMCKKSKADDLGSQIAKLQNSLRECTQDKDKQAEVLLQCQEAKNTQIDKLNQAMRNLEESLKEELAAQQAKLEMTERGLVVTFLSEIFFDSGKDQIRKDADTALKSVADVLKEDVAGSNVAVEGHTDNEPIKYSGWKSNWELASARALAVLHYFVDECEINPKRLSAISYGEYKPTDDNQTKEGMQRNRRVEIIILPELTKEQR
jgi:flagellar motor protein MotB